MVKAAFAWFFLCGICLGQLTDAPAESPESFDSRSWTSKSGTTIVAKLLDLEGDSVKLVKKDGAFVTVKLDQLSITDRAYCAWIQKQAQTVKPAESQEKQAKFDLIEAVENSLAEFSVAATLAENEGTTLAKNDGYSAAIRDLRGSLQKVAKKPFSLTAVVQDVRADAGSFVIEVDVQGSGKKPYLATITSTDVAMSRSLSLGDRIEISGTTTPSKKTTSRVVIAIPVRLDPQVEQACCDNSLLSNLFSNRNMIVTTFATSIKKID